MDSTYRPCVFPKSITKASAGDKPEQAVTNLLHRKIMSIEDVIHFKTMSSAYRNIISYVDLLANKIVGQSNKVLNGNYEIKDELFLKCAKFLDRLKILCDETDLSKTKCTGTLRFGHIAYRDWFDDMKRLSREFVDESLAAEASDQLREEIFVYLSESFGNRMRIDYGTGHELNFIIFTMGLSLIDQLRLEKGKVESNQLNITQEKLNDFVANHGWDIHALFAHKYLRLCRKVQIKFRLEPAGSRGVYNMDDFQFLPFLFGAAQLNGVKYISPANFCDPDQVDMFKKDFIFMEAVDFILNNKRGPFYEHSYTLWGFTGLNSWENIHRRIKTKFIEEVLSPFPVIQHLLFGNHVLRWE